MKQVVDSFVEGAFSSRNGSIGLLICFLDVNSSLSTSAVAMKIGSCKLVAKSHSVQLGRSWWSTKGSKSRSNNTVGVFRTIEPPEDIAMSQMSLSLFFVLVLSIAQRGKMLREIAD